MPERAGCVPLLDQGLRRLQLERGDAMRIEAEPLRRLDALLEILEGREIAIGSEEDLGEIFEGLEVSLRVLREAGGGYRLLTLPDQFCRGLVHALSSDEMGPRSGPPFRIVKRPGT